MADLPTQSTEELFQLSNGRAARTAGDAQNSQRIQNEIDYVDYFAKKLGECLGMRALELGIVEDVDFQTAFYYAPGPDGAGSVVNGFLSNRKRPFGKIVDELRGEH